MRLKVLMFFTAVSLLSFGLVSANAKTNTENLTGKISSNIEGLQSLPTVISGVKSPDITTPNWLKAELDAEQAAKVAAELAKKQISTKVASGTHQTVNYVVSTKGITTADISEFKADANQTLNDSRGWARLGIAFQEVASGGSFTLVLSEASQLPSFSSICSIYWSCRVGNYIIINQDRWLNASDSWNQAGGSLRNYRNMVINHETGHWLGHRDDNAHCGGSGQPAPIMQQQSINLLGCSFNPWPLNSELWSSRLGIYL
jgi:hypothetical protein